ncbi:MAGUK p55 family member stardust isoform X2 [Dermatophagoides farinae]|uniref:MAGUK p55 family member stardust isoform X2 n=1 Tax=Dermatophagoides farinae TaxID=6954 RepID=UPI003F5D6EB4
MVDIGGYVIVLVERDDKIKLFGSPAERKDCDEILEVNGNNLDNMSHKQIIDYIHQCIKSRTICLRVKRRNTDKLELDSSPIDAFIIGNRAREHFDKIVNNNNIDNDDDGDWPNNNNKNNIENKPNKSTSSSSSTPNKNRKTPTKVIKPRDIAELSKLLNEEDNRPQQHQQVEIKHQQPSSVIQSFKQHKSLSPTSSNQSSSNRDSTQNSTSNNSSDFIVITTTSSSSVIANTQRQQKVIATSTDVNPSSSFKYAKLTSESGYSISSVCLNAETSYDKTIIVEQEQKQQPESNKMELVELNSQQSHHHHHHHHHNHHHTHPHQQQHQQHQSFQIHRELPVDVPDSFVGVVKQTPRYPPPQPPQRFTSTSSSSGPANAHSVTTTTDQRLNLTDKYRKYSDEFNRKKEEEEFLRSSLRSSTKLQQLKEQNNNGHHMIEPMVNIAFEPDDDQQQQQLMVSYSNNGYGSFATTQQPPSSNIRMERESDKVLPLPYLEMIVENIRQSLNADLKELIQESKLKNLVSIYSVLMQHQHSKMNSYLDSQQSLRPPSYNSITRPMNHPPSQSLHHIHHHQPEILNLQSPPQPVHGYSHHPSNVLPFGGNNCNNDAIASDSLQETINTLQQNLIHPDAAELLEILTRFELETLCYAYDRVLAESQKNMLALLPDEIHEDKVHEIEMLDTLHSGVKVVQIEKTSCEPLGATVRNEPDGSVIIGRIIKGGAAHKSGMLHEGDEILEVNGIEMKGRNVNQVCDLLSEMTGTLTFVIAIRDSLMRVNPHLMGATVAAANNQVLHLRALFDYDPDEDLYIPCRELGICFNKGDILHVIDQSDINWWQAYREGDEHDQSLAGLIPSIQFQIQREAMKQSILNDSTVNTSNRKSRFANGKPKSPSLLFNCGKRSLERKKKKNSKQRLILTHEEILTYEEVCYYHPRPNFKRPIVLIGPANIGRHELRQRLMQDTDRFAAAVPHTSRPRKDGEFDGIDYHFISRQMFEHDIKESRFVEHGEYEKNYYGTSFAAIEAVVHSGKICVLNLHVHSIPLLRQGQAGAKLKPFFVFVAPPTQPENLHRLLALKNTSEGSTFTVADYQSIIDEATEIEIKFGHFFDMVLQMTDIESAYQELLTEINALDHEPQWIPSQWVK